MRPRWSATQNRLGRADGPGMLTLRLLPEVELAGAADPKRCVELARHSHALLCLDGAFFELNGRGVPLLPLLS